MNIYSDLIRSRVWRDRCNLVVFVRHGERESVPSHEFPRHDAPLTADGRRQAEALGVLLSDRLGTVRTSPVSRCVDTAAALIGGAKRLCTAVHDRLLGDPGAYVADGDLAMSELISRGFHPAARQLGNGEQLRGFVDPDSATTQLVSLAQSLFLTEKSGIHLLVTHDLIISTMIARIRGAALDELEWPGFLHGITMWQEGESLLSQYASVEYTVPKRIIQGR